MRRAGAPKPGFSPLNVKLLLDRGPFQAEIAPAHRRVHGAPPPGHSNNNLRMLRTVLALATAAAAAADPPTLAPAGFDCKTRHLAMEYAQKIQPFRSKADFEVLSKVLDMHGGGPGGPAQ